MNRLALALCFASLVAHAQSPQPDAKAPAASAASAPGTPAGPRPSAGDQERGDEVHDAEDTGPWEGGKRRSECPDGFGDEDEDDGADTAVLAPLQLDVDGQHLTPAGLDLQGLHRLTDAQVRSLIGAPPANAARPLSSDETHTLLRRLARTGLFARVTPRLSVSEQGPSVLEVLLEENPTVTSVEIEGVEDLLPREVLEKLLQLPRRFPDEDVEDDEELVTTLRIHRGRGTLSVVSQCPPPRPPREWLARMEHGEFRPGIILGGLDAAMERVVKELRADDGYLLATLSATLTPDGKLVVSVDEGRLEAVDVQGVEPPMAARAREALGLEPGDVFLRSDARRAVERLEARLPFLRAVGGEGLREGRRTVRVIEEREPDGTRHYRTLEEERRKPRRREQVSFVLSWSALFDWEDDDRGEGITLDGRRLVVHLRPRSPDLSAALLPVHTQVTGFAPGLEAHLRIWDPKDRVHATLDSAFFIPLRLGGQRLPDDPEGTRRQRRVSLLGGARLEVPAVGLAELGAQAHDFTDTLDRWRLGDIDSYVYSFLINRPDRDYFRRKGFAAFATWRWSDAWLAGAEFHGDTYESLQSFTPPLSLFRRDHAPFPNAPVSEGRFHSVVLRMEYNSNAEPGTRVGSLFRTPETSLFKRDGDWEHEPNLRGLVTLEVGEGPGASGADTRFWKLVSDVALDVPFGWHSAVGVRVRAAGGEDLPLQKQEALGGWSALRGFGFKDLRGGDSSVLASFEARWHAFGVFADVGSVHADSAWSDARLGVGGSFHFGDDVRAEVAWRTDEKATATPEARLFFVRTF